MNSSPSDDLDRPSLEFLDDSTALLRLRDLGLDYRLEINSLILANHARLVATPYLIVDVRGVGGGCTCSFENLLPLLYSQPIHVFGAQVWSSAANAEALRSWLAEEHLPESMKSRIRLVLPQMQESPGEFVVFAEDEEITYDTMYPMPRRVAVLIDRGCASSCEDFVLAARQSEKVTVIGAENTGGVGDYGNVRSLWLPGWRRLRVPMSRSNRLLVSGPLDNIGIAPDLRAPRSVADLIGYARQHLISADHLR